MPAHDLVSALKFSCLRVKGLDSQAFDALVQQVHNYYCALAEETVLAPADEVHVAQGRAQGMKALVRLMVECDSVLAKPQPPHSP